MRRAHMLCVFFFHPLIKFLDTVETASHHMEVHWQCGAAGIEFFEL